MVPAGTRMLEDLRALGIRENGVLLVHASLRSLGKVEGGAETVIQVLLEALGDNGTLLLPALSYETVGAENPCFNARKTPSCVGALPEYFRQREGTLRSIHPTHSVCSVGKRAGDILSDHNNDTTPCGSNSPFHKLPDCDGQILFLGCGLRPNTSIHAIEELSEPPYLYGPMVDYEIVDSAGSVSKMSVRSHNFRGWVQRYDRLAQILDREALRTGRVLDADCHLVEASAMWVAAHDQLKKEPLFFVDRESVVNTDRCSLA
jgi:aminoglycoside 3-N-acetyltransferase